MTTRVATDCYPIHFSYGLPPPRRGRGHGHEAAPSPENTDMGNTEDQDEDSDEGGGNTQTLQHQDTVAQDDTASAAAAPVGWGRLIPVPTAGFRGSGPVAITGDMWVGRGKHCDVVIGKQRISTRHVALRAMGAGAVYITDHSTNGTHVSGTRLSKGIEQLLSGGDEVDLAGAAKYIYQPAKPAAAAAAAAAGSGATAAAAAGAGAAASSKMDDTMAQTMTCGICQEILYKCVSAVPCLHNFCSACASDCLKRSSECPMCRAEISEVRRNHDLSNLIDAFLDAHPERRRSDAEIAEMDARSTITTESLRVSKKRAAPDGGAAGRYDDQSDDYGDDYGDGYASDEGPDEPISGLPPTPAYMRCPNCPPAPGQLHAAGIFTCPPAPGEYGPRSASTHPPTARHASLSAAANGSRGACAYVTRQRFPREVRTQVACLERSFPRCSVATACSLTAIMCSARTAAASCQSRTRRRSQRAASSAQRRSATLSSAPPPACHPASPHSGRRWRARPARLVGSARCASMRLSTRLGLRR